MRRRPEMLFAVHELRASRVNLLMNDFAAGLPSPLAFLGLGAAVAPDLGAPRWKVGVLPVLHEVHVSKGRTKPEMAPKGDHFAPIEITEDLVGFVRVSLLLDVPSCSDEHKVAEALLGRRVAGGVIGNESIRVTTVAADGGALKALARGYAVVRPDTPKLRIIATGEIADLADLAAALFPATREPGAGWFVPVAVGHRLLEDPAIRATAPPRANTRDPSIPHVFTEPVVGIAELVSVRNPRLTGLDGDGLSDLLWHWTAEGEWIVGHPFYHPDRRTAAKEEHARAQE